MPPAESSAPLPFSGHSDPRPSALPRDQPETLMSSWSPEPGMWALSQIGLAAGPRAGRGRAVGPCPGLHVLQASGQPCPEAVCSCVRRQVSGQDPDRPSSSLGLEETTALEPLGLRACSKACQRQPGPVREGKPPSLCAVCCVLCAVCQGPGCWQVGGWGYLQTSAGVLRHFPLGGL